MNIPIYGRGLGDTIVAQACIDDEDAPLVGKYRWRLCRLGQYAETHAHGHTIQMHRLIMGLKIGDPRQVDHIAGHPLDNRKAELRIVPNSAAQNQNYRPKPGASSGYRGVTWHRGVGKWQAQVKLDGTCHYLGLFDDVRAAARAASQFRAVHMPYSIEEAGAAS